MPEQPTHSCTRMDNLFLKDPIRSNGLCAPGLPPSWELLPHPPRISPLFTPYSSLWAQHTSASQEDSSDCSDPH